MSLDKFNARVSPGALKNDKNVDLPASLPEAEHETDNNANDVDLQKRLQKRKIRQQQILEHEQQSDVMRQENQPASVGWKKALAGEFGPQASSMALAFDNSTELQKNLSLWGKAALQKSMETNPEQAIQAGSAMLRLAQKPNFGQSLNTAPQVSLVQDALLRDPMLEADIAQAMDSTFMQSPQAEPQTKEALLRFIQQQQIANRAAVLGKTVGMLDTLVDTDTALAQRAAMAMAERNPNNALGMENVDVFARARDMQRLSSQTRAAATNVLARANGATEVRYGLERLAQDPTFQKQSERLQGRIFSTIGQAAPLQTEALTNTTLKALQNRKFPKQPDQINKFLQKLSEKTATGDAANIDGEQLIQIATQSPAPKIPALISMLNLDEAEIQKVRMQNTAKIIEYYNQLEGCYREAENKIQYAQWLEDIKYLPNLREPGAFDVTNLSPQERALIAGKSQKMNAWYKELIAKQQHKQRFVEHMPRDLRRLREQSRRMRGQQPVYFKKSAIKILADAKSPVGNKPQVSTTAQKLAPASSQAAPAANHQMQQAIRTAVQKEIQKLLPQIEQRVKAQLGVGQKNPVAKSELDAEPKNVEPPKKITTGRLDAYGLPRTFERDLGNKMLIVKPKQQIEVSTQQDLPGNVRKVSLVDDFKSFLATTEWKSIEASQRMELQNIGWDGQLWSTAQRNNDPSAWPAAMRRRFANLSDLNRTAVLNLRFNEDTWDNLIDSLDNASSRAGTR